MGALYRVSSRRFRAERGPAPLFALFFVCANYELRPTNNASQIAITGRSAKPNSCLGRGSRPWSGGNAIRTARRRSPNRPGTRRCMRSVWYRKRCCGIRSRSSTRRRSLLNRWTSWRRRTRGPSRWSTSGRSASRRRTLRRTGIRPYFGTGRGSYFRRARRSMRRPRFGNRPRAGNCRRRLRGPSSACR